MRYRLRDWIAELREWFFEDRAPGRPEQLAAEIVEYGRMNRETPGIFLIAVPEVAYRLRESRRHIRQSLRLLEMKGIADATDDEDLWELSA